MSAGLVPCIRNQAGHCFQIRYWASASAFIARDVVLMPCFVNLGARVEQGTMVDTWATVGSCAQIGANVHISGGTGIGGVLEPVQANPVIIEDNCFIGARSEVAEGVIVEEGSVLAMGLPVGVALFGIGIGVAIITLISNVITVPEFATFLGIMIGLGVGIDYALLIVTRYREQLHSGHTVRESIAIATLSRSPSCWSTDHRAWRYPPTRSWYASSAVVHTKPPW